MTEFTSSTDPLSGWRYRALFLSIALSAAGYLGFSLWVGWNDVVGALIRMSYATVVLALLLSLVNYGLRFVRWQSYLAALGHRIPNRASLRIYISGFALTTTPGKSGEAIRSIFLKHHGVSYTESLAAFFSERFSDVIAILLLSGLGLWMYEPARPVLAIAGLAIAGWLVLLQRVVWLRALESGARRYLSGRLGALSMSLIRITLHSGQCFSPRLLVSGLVLGLIAWGAEGLAFHYVLNGLGSTLPLRTALFIYAFSMLVGALTFMPGGLGGAEATMAGLLLLNDMPEHLAVGATIFIRLATLWFAVALGILALPRKVNS